jgi:hypothetical protein
MLLFPDSARVTGAFWWLAGTDLAPTQTRISESLKPKKRSWLSLQIIENMIHLLLKLVVSLSGRHQGPYLVFESHAFRVVLVKPSLRGFLAVEDLRWSRSPTCLLVST